jgi:magnesium transporter
MAAGVAAISLYRARPRSWSSSPLTMVIIVLWGSLLGMSLPFLLTRLGLDPATASAPLITSLADISGVLIYFSVASWYLGGGGHVQPAAGPAHGDAVFRGRQPEPAG